MSSQQPQNVSYGLSQALLVNSPSPVPSKRNPNVNDFMAIGTIWSNVLTNTIFILASITNNAANWVQVETAGGAGVFANLTVTPGPISLTGTTTINTVGAANTNIGTFPATGNITIGNAAGLTTINGAFTAASGGAINIDATGIFPINIGSAGNTGAVNIGNTTGGTAVTGVFISNGGNIELNPGGIGDTDINLAPNTGAINMGNATGNTFITDGELVVVLGNITIQSAHQGYVLPTGCVILSGAGDPNGVAAFAAPIGSLYLNSTGSTTINRLYINTDGGTTWTYFTAHA